MYVYIYIYVYLFDYFLFYLFFDWFVFIYSIMCLYFLFKHNRTFDTHTFTDTYWYWKRERERGRIRENRAKQCKTREFVLRLTYCHASGVKMSKSGCELATGHLWSVQLLPSRRSRFSKDHSRGVLVQCGLSLGGRLCLKTALNLLGHWGTNCYCYSDIVGSMSRWLAVILIPQRTLHVICLNPLLFKEQTCTKANFLLKSNVWWTWTMQRAWFLIPLLTLLAPTNSHLPSTPDVFANGPMKESFWPQDLRHSMPM